MGQYICLLSVSQADATAILRDPPSLPDYVDEHRENVSDLDKAGHGITYLLAGPWADGDKGLLGFLLTGGDDPQKQWIGKYNPRKGVCEVDVGYGPASFYPARFVALRVADAVRTVSSRQARSRFDPEEMVREYIYPHEVWQQDDALDYLMEHFKRFRSYLLRASRRKHALIVWTQ